MRILEIIHDIDHPEFTNIDLWVREMKCYETKKIKAYENFDKPDFNSYDLIILHGGVQHIWNKEAHPWLYREIDFIKENVEKGKTVLGFCLGCQIIAEVLGGKVYKAKEKEIGWFDIKIREQYCGHQLLNGLGDSFNTFLWHSDHFSLPEDCKSLAYTEAAINQILVSERYPVVGYQFHPEYTKGIVKFFFETEYDNYWIGGKYVAQKEGFLEKLEKRPETYPLFKKLMSNALKYLNSKFE